MRATRLLSLALAAVVLVAAPAAANEPPRPQLMVAETLLLPLMILLSAAGGAYTILRALQPTRKARTALKASAAVLAVLASGATSGIAVVVVAIFAALALRRGVQMVRWSLRARSAHGRPAYLTAVSAPRLMGAGVALLVLTTSLLGMAVAFAAYWPMGEETRQQAFRNFVAYQMAVGRRAQVQAERTHRTAGPAGTAAPRSCAIGLPPGARLEYASDGRDFTVLLPPKTAFPFFPYNYLTSQPSYRADGTGAIRMIAVHDRDTVCPPEAPVVTRVSEAEIQHMLERINATGDCP
jgi:hypothetical protein